MKKLALVVLFSILNFQAHADGTSVYQKIADCSQKASQNDPASQYQVFRMGQNTSDANSLLVHIISAGTDVIFPVQSVDLQDNGNTAVIRIANFLFLTIHNGNSKDSTSTIMLGDGPKNMTCKASLK